MRLRMWEVLRVCIVLVVLKTAIRLVLVSSAIKTVLDIYTSSLVSASIRMVYFLHAARWGRERVSIDLRIVPTDLVGSLNHIKPSI